MQSKLRGLTLHRPWPHAIFKGGKNIVRRERIRLYDVRRLKRQRANLELMLKERIVWKLWLKSEGKKRLDRIDVVKARYRSGEHQALSVIEFIVTAPDISVLSSGCSWIEAKPSLEDLDHHVYLTEIFNEWHECDLLE